MSSVSVALKDLSLSLSNTDTSPIFEMILTSSKRFIATKVGQGFIGEAGGEGVSEGIIKYWAL